MSRTADAVESFEPRSKARLALRLALARGTLLAIFEQRWLAGAPTRT